MKKALVVGGSNGIGLAITLRLLKKYHYDYIYIVDKNNIDYDDLTADEADLIKKYSSIFCIDLIKTRDFSFLNKFKDINTLIITVGFGRVSLFKDIESIEIPGLIKCNMSAPIAVIKHFYNRINSTDDFFCAVMGSIAGHVVSPFFSVYSAAKSGLCRFIENLNIELMCNNIKNRILDVSPGSLKGTKFNGGKNDISVLSDITDEAIEKMISRETLFIPSPEIYLNVVERYKKDPAKFGAESYGYKLNSGRIISRPNFKIGYLSGTFDLFHIGHLNLLKRAKNECDYLIVGVHKDGSWKGKQTFIPFDERVSILESIVYVDKVVESFPEDIDAYDFFHYDKLFVGSDYKGSERFRKYETYFKDKNVDIIYFPYTKGTSSTQLREALSKE